METVYENRPVIIFGDSYTVCFGKFKDDLTKEGIRRLKLCSCVGLTLYGYFIDRYTHGWKKGKHDSLINGIDICFGKWNKIKKKYKKY